MARLRLRPSSREKELSTKGSTKNREQREKIYPRRATKNDEGPRRGWRRLERDPPRVAKGRERISRKRQKDFHEGPRRTAKGHEGVGGGSRGIRQKSPRGEKGFPGKGKKISTKGHEERRRATKGLEKTQEGSAKSRQGEKGFPGKGKKISTKGHEERRRATKGLEEAREGSAKGRQGERKDFQEKAKRFPRRTLGLSAKGTRIRELTRSKADKKTGRSQTTPGGSRTRTSPREGPLAVDRSASGDDRWRTSTSPRNPVGR